jgi:hypothetical protein
MALNQLDRTLRSAKTATAHRELVPAVPRGAATHAVQGRRLCNKKLRAQAKHNAHTASPALVKPSRGTAVRTFAVAAAEVKTQVRLHQ